MEPFPSFPSVLFPKYNENLTCKHGNHFNENDDFLSKVSDVVIVYDERGERIEFMNQQFLRENLNGVV